MNHAPRPILLIRNKKGVCYSLVCRASSSGDKHSEELMSLIEGLRGEIEVMKAQLA